MATFRRPLLQSAELFGVRRDIPAKSWDIPSLKFGFSLFEGHAELFGPHPFTSKTPTPPENIRTQNFGFVLFFLCLMGGTQTGRLIFIHLRCWEVLPFLTIQRQRGVKFRVLKPQDFYTPLPLNFQKGQHLPALVVYKNQSPTNGYQKKRVPTRQVFKIKKEKPF